jgi:hypothetical protein
MSSFQYREIKEENKEYSKHIAFFLNKNPEINI